MVNFQKVNWPKSPLKHDMTKKLWLTFWVVDNSSWSETSNFFQVIIWDVDLNTWVMTPRLMLVGHTSPVRCIAKASGGPGKLLVDLTSGLVLITVKQSSLKFVVFNPRKAKLRNGIFFRLSPHCNEHRERRDGVVGHS
jgi:hypothetical protein